MYSRFCTRLQMSPSLSENPCPCTMAPKPKPKPKSKANANSNPYFKPHSAIEISSYDDGFRGSWYAGTVIRRCASKNGRDHYLVEYKTLMADEEGTKPLRETLDIVQLRPVPPREVDWKFKFGDEVDAYYNDGWWEGAITEEHGNGKFSVFFRGSREQMIFGSEELRLHREWINENWVPPLNQEKLSIPNEVKPCTTTAKEHFGEGTVVEVSCDEDGFQGAWFAATIAKRISKDKFLVEYQTLRSDDDSEFLREEIDSFHIRPYPPETCIDCEFSLLEEVDALYNDGWWVGVISKVLGKSRYIVYFKGTNEEMEFRQSQLRLHQEWINETWVVASKALKL